MEARFNYQMMELARTSRGLTQKELADTLNRTQTLISKWEHNSRQPNPEDVASIAKALDYPVAFFYEQEIDAYLPPVQGHYRKKAALKSVPRAKMEAHFRLAGGWINKLQDAIEPEDGLGFPSFDDDDLVEFTGDPEALARAMRRKWRLGNGPIRSLTNTIENHKVVVLQTWMWNEHIDGYSFFTTKGVPVIYVNRTLPLDRMRFSIAHELGHLIMHSDVMPSPEREKEAHRFASEFLMPTYDIDQQLQNFSIQKLPSLKTYWGCSMASILRKARDTGNISKDEYVSFQVSLSRYRKKEPIDISQYNFIEQPLLLKEMMLFHLEEDDMSHEELRDMLKLNFADYSNLLTALGMQDRSMFIAS